MKFNLRLLYLYLFSAVGLIILIIGGVRLVELGLKVFVFRGADTFEYVKPAPIEINQNVSTEEAKHQEVEAVDYQKRETLRQRQREFSGALAMILIGLPLYTYHWKTIKKEHKE